MSEPRRAEWDERHRDKPAGEAEPFLTAMLARIPRGDALDVAAGRGRNALALARAGMRVVAVDFSSEAMRLLAATARAARVAIWPVVANLDSFISRMNLSTPS
ncbi:MAG TPA: class I SAM-dependent methyltransferase [Candidatus Binatus sp.]|uniref:class I SAM-dependent methyltransferase n=1 Tax=Candidatus Binatus sp. TaxID=2811406 RepID=UPI002B49CA87|nr:class I SAM-dependent methyltransferase [Candidatus Binatus sp.]HKN13627.1 class I SAM-dependent methyltransferase [Candidatus Binatus sp.]